ncbi:MAG: hypothetical protein SNJ82_09635 [Gemmataceae bacterium]
MKRPMLLLWEAEESLASRLRGSISLSRWLLRQPHREEELLAEAMQACPGVVVLRLGHDVERELTLLSRLTMALPDLAVVVLTDDETLAGLGWDLGAYAVLDGVSSRDLLVPLVTRLLQPTENSHAADA